MIYGVTLHFAAVDWAMSIKPAFHSSIWGPLFALGQLLSALCLAVIVLNRRAAAPPLAELGLAQGPRRPRQPDADLSDRLGLHGLVPVHADMDRQSAVGHQYYLPRGSAHWLAVIWLIVLLHFAVPFFLLLIRAVKRNSRRLAATAGLLLAMQLLFVYYEITPSFAASSVTPAATTPGPPATSPAAYWMDFVMPIGLGGIWLSCFLWTLRARPLIVAGDPMRAAAIHLRRLDDEEAAGTCAWVRRRWPMSSERETPHADGRVEHPDSPYEEKDLHVGPILALLIATGCIFAVMFAVDLYFFHATGTIRSPRKRRRLIHLPSTPRVPCRRRRDWTRSTAWKNSRAKAMPTSLPKWSGNCTPRPGRPTRKGSSIFPSSRAMKEIVKQLPLRKGPPEKAAEPVHAGESNSGRMLPGAPPWSEY